MQNTPTPIPTQMKQAKRHSAPTGVLGADLTADGSRAYLACMDGVYELVLESGAVRRLYQHESYASGAVLLESRQLLITAGYDGFLSWWDLAAGRHVRTERAHQFWSWDLAASPDGKYVVSVTGQYLAGGYKYEPAPEREPSVRVYEVETGRLAHSWSHVPSVQSVAVSPDSKLVAAGNLMGEVRIWDLQSGEERARFQSDAFTSWGIIKSHCYLGGIFALAFSPDSQSLLLSGMGPMVDPMAGNGRQLWQQWAWSEKPARLIREAKPSETGEGLMETLALHPGGESFVMSGRLRGGQWNTGLFSLADGQLKASTKTDSRVTRAQFSRDGKQLYLAGTRRQPNLGKDGTIPAYGHFDIYDLS